MDQAVLNNLFVKLSDVGLKLLSAVAIWVVGRILIKFVLNMVAAHLERRKVDHTLVGYARSTISVVANIALVVILMGALGIETSSFAAFIAGAGLAIGAAWSGLLSNFAAGVFLVILRPFKMGDYISGGGLEGTVTEIGLFVTTILTPDRVIATIGNSKLLGSNLKNFTASGGRRIEMIGTVRRSDDLEHILPEIQARLAKIPNVLASPAAEVSVFSFRRQVCHLAIRPYVHTDHYWEVYFAVTDNLRDLLDGLQSQSERAREEEREEEHAREMEEKGGVGEEHE